jgi:hypothetical protein
MAKQSVRAISAADVPRSRGARSSAAVQSAPENKKKSGFIVQAK